MDHLVCKIEGSRSIDAFSKTPEPLQKRLIRSKIIENCNCSILLLQPYKKEIYGKHIDSGQGQA